MAYNEKKNKISFFIKIQVNCSRLPLSFPVPCHTEPVQSNPKRTYTSEIISNFYKEKPLRKLRKIILSIQLNKM